MGVQFEQPGYVLSRDVTSLANADRLEYLRLILLAADGDADATLHANMLWFGARDDVAAIISIRRMIDEKWQDDPTRRGQLAGAIRRSPGVRLAMDRELRASLEGYPDWTARK